MKIAQVKTLSPEERLVYWISEREAIRERRAAGEPKPWTDDEILQRYRFCNVRRMDDKVSQWLLENWYKPNYNHHNMLAACALARFINLPSSLSQIGFPFRWEPKRIKKCLRDWRGLGQQVFNGAYMVRNDAGIDKIEYVVNRCVCPLVKDRLILDPRGMESTWLNLLSSYGFGSFMAGQVIADLRWGIDGSWDDRYEWAPMGPGSKRGLNLLWGRPVNNPMKQSEFLDGLHRVTKICREKLPRRIVSRLEAIDFQNCLCEYFKYSRVLSGGQRPKALFRSER